jgi:hypothetical protein
MGDSRVVFLIWFVCVAIVIAVGLIFVEIRVKRKKDMILEKKKNKTPVDKMRIFLKGDVSVREKLDVIGKTAKDYFKSEYKMSQSLGYRELSKEFEKKKMRLESEFCNEMFEAYYSNYKSEELKIKRLADMVAEICGRKNVVVKIVNKVPGVKEKVEKVTGGVRGFLMGKIDAYVKLRNEREERKARVIERQERELFSWIRKAIRMGYDKEKILALLDDGKRSKSEVKRVLSIYEMEVLKFEKEKEVVSPVQDKAKEGIAQRIIQQERRRLEEVGA